MKLFRKLGGRDDFLLAMLGVKLGDRVLQIGCADHRLLALFAGRVGLTGRAAAVDPNAEVTTRARQAAASAGVLVEFETASCGALPYEADAFDLVIVRAAVGSWQPPERVSCLQEALRVLRPGGRGLLIEAAPRGGLGALLQRRGIDVHYAGTGGAEAALSAEGFRGVRRVAEREGLAFIEGVKPAA